MSSGISPSSVAGSALVESRGLGRALIDWCRTNVDRSRGKPTSGRVPVLPRVHAVRAPEVDDLIWENLWAKGQLLHDYIIPLITIVLIFGSLYPTGSLVFYLTSFKLDLARAAEISISRESRLLATPG